MWIAGWFDAYSAAFEAMIRYCEWLVRRQLDWGIGLIDVAGVGELLLHGRDARRADAEDTIVGRPRGRAIVGERRMTDMTMQSNRMCALIMLMALAAVNGSVPTHAADTEQMVTLNPQTLEFTQIPDMPACASAAILRGNPRYGPAWVLLKLASGCQVPWHWHSANETLVVISGRGTVSMKDGPPLRFLPGAYASLPSHHQHMASCSRTCVLFNGADAAFDIHYVDASGEEISADKALKPSAKPKAEKK